MARGRQDLGGQWWKLGGGGTLPGMPSSTIRVTNLVYFGVGNGTPVERPLPRSTTEQRRPVPRLAGGAWTWIGKYVWHYQETPADTWDYDAVSPLSVVDMKIDGKERRVLLQPSKNGFYYVIEARSGKLLHASPFVDVNWADGVDMKTGRPRTRRKHAIRKASRST